MSVSSSLPPLSYRGTVLKPALTYGLLRLNISGIRRTSGEAKDRMFMVLAGDTICNSVINVDITKISELTNTSVVYMVGKHNKHQSGYKLSSHSWVFLYKGCLFSRLTGRRVRGRQTQSGQATKIEGKWATRVIPLGPAEPDHKIPQSCDHWWYDETVTMMIASLDKQLAECPDVDKLGNLFGIFPVLADAMEEAGCGDQETMNLLRSLD